MKNCWLARPVAIACSCAALTIGCIATIADASNCFARFTYARATVNWGACPSGGTSNTTQDLEKSAGTCGMSASAATAAGQCAPTDACSQAQATGNGNLESFFASTFTFPCPNANYASAEIRYVALRRHKGNLTTNGVVGPLVTRARGEYILTGPFTEFAGVFLPMDITEDGIVNGADLSEVIAKFGSTSSTTLADTNCDGIVDLTDLARVLATWKTDGATP